MVAAVVVVVVVVVVVTLLSSWMSSGADLVWPTPGADGLGLGGLRLVFSGGLRKRLAMPVGMIPGCKPRNGVSRARTPSMRCLN